GAVEAGEPVIEDAAVAGHEPVADPVRRGGRRGGGGDTDHRRIEADIARRTEEGGVAVVEDPAVGSRQPVAAAGRGGGHAHDRRVEADRTGGAGEAHAGGGDAAV